MKADMQIFRKENIIIQGTKVKTAKIQESKNNIHKVIDKSEKQHECMT